jgi:DNA-binding transcriptional LysR family regulator
MRDRSELAAFVQTVDRGSQSAAARVLGITPAMVGRYIQALETRIGARLLNRTTQKQSLTETGQVFYQRIAAILDQLEDAEREASEQAPEPRGLLRVGGPMTFGWRHLAPAVSAFCETNPKLRVELTLDDRTVDLIDGGYDVAVRIGALKDSSLIVRRLASCPMLICAAPAYIGRFGVPRRPEDLREHRCLLYSYDRSGDHWRFESGDEVQVSGHISANNGDALLVAALDGQGIILQPGFIVGDALRAGLLVRLLADHPIRSIDVHAVFPSVRHLSLKVRRFVDFLATRFREL